MHAPAASVAGVAGPGQRAHRMAELLISAVPSGVTGWRSLALVDELTGATSSGSRLTLALVYMLGQLQRIQPEALDAPDFVGIGAKPARQDGRRGPRSSRSGPLVLLPLRALDAVLCAHRPARGVNWIGRSSSPGPPTIRTLGADGRSPLPLRPRSNVIAALKAMAEV